MRNVSVGGMKALERGDKMFSSLLTPDPAAYGMLAFSYKQTDAVKAFASPIITVSAPTVYMNKLLSGLSHSPGLTLPFPFDLINYTALAYFTMFTTWLVL